MLRRRLSLTAFFYNKCTSDEAHAQNPWKFLFSFARSKIWANLWVCCNTLVQVNKITHWTITTTTAIIVIVIIITGGLEIDLNLHLDVLLHITQPKGCRFRLWQWFNSYALNRKHRLETSLYSKSTVATKKVYNNSTRDKPADCRTRDLIVYIVGCFSLRRRATSPPIHLLCLTSTRHRQRARPRYLTNDASVDARRHNL